MLRKLLIVAGVLLAVLASGLLLVMLRLDVDGFLTARLQRLLPEAERRLGRAAAFDRVDTVLGWGLHGEVRGLRVAGGAPDAPPLVEVARARVGLDLWRAVISFGSDVRVREVVVRGLRLQLHRDAQGRLSYQDVVDRLAGDSAPSAPLTEEEKATLRGLQVARFAVEDAAFDLRDDSAGGEPVRGSISHVWITAADLRLGAPLDVSVRARVFSEEENLRLRIVTGPLADDPDELAAPALERLHVTAGALDVSRVAPYLGGGLPIGIDSATLGGDLELTTPEGTLQVKGELAARHLLLTGGEAFDADIVADLAIAPDLSRLLIRRADAKIAGMEVAAKGDLHDLTGEPRIEGLSVRAPRLDTARLLAVLPPLRGALPRGARVVGLASLAATGSGDASGQQIEATLDLDAVDARLPGLLIKPKGVACKVTLVGQLLPGRLTLRRARAQLGPMALDGKGTVALGRRVDTDVSFETQPFALDGLARLLPPVAKATPDGVTWGGTGAVRARLKTLGDRVDGSASIHLTGARVEVPDFALRGEWRGDLTVRGAERDLQVVADIDLTQAGLHATGSVDKPVGMPARVQAELRRTPARLDVARAELDLGPVSLRGSGALGTADSRVRIEVPKVELGALARVFPSLREVFPKPGHIAVVTVLRGNPDDPHSLVADVERLALGIGRTRVTASGRVRNTERPSVELRADAAALYLDELFPPSDEAPGQESAKPDLSPLRAFDGRASVRAKRGSWDGDTFTNLVADVVLTRGQLQVKTLDVGAWGGNLSLSGTTVDARSDDPVLAVRAKVRAVDAGALLGSQTSLKRYLTGRLSTTIEATGRGASWEGLAPSLAGQLSGKVTRGRFLGINAYGAAVKPLLSKLPARYRNPPGVRLDALAGTAFSELAGALEIRDGRLHILKDLVVNTPQGPLAFDGAIGLDKALDLRGRFDLSPAAVNQLTAGRFRPGVAIPVRMKVGGTLLRPRFEGVDMKATGEALLKGVLASEAAAKVKAATDQAREEAERRVRELQARAEEEAGRRADELKRRAAEERRRLEKKARDEAKAVRKRAEAEARKRATEARKRAEKAAREKAEEAARELRRRFGF